MAERYTDEVFPFTWGGWDEMGGGAIQFYDVEFTEDFGPAKKGDKVEAVFVDLSSGVLELYVDDKKAHEIRFKAVAVEGE